MRNIYKFVIVALVALSVGGIATAGASKFIDGNTIKPGTITSHQIKDGSVRLKSLSSGTQAILAKVGKPGQSGGNGTNGSNGKDGTTGSTGPKGDTGATGVTGAQGAKGDRGDAGARGSAGDSYLSGAYYSVAYYDSGDTNGGAIATVACRAQTDTAISGGVSVDDPSKNVPVGQSFPGRMDWSANAPMAGRLDGWIVQFASSSSAPEKVKVWALCVPGLNVPVDQTYTESADQ